MVIQFKSRKNGDETPYFCRVHLDRLTLFQFKNYAEAEFQFGNGANALTGPNGSGKTNVLDAIHYLCLCKSYFNASDSHTCRFGEQFFSVSGTFHRDDEQVDVLVSVKSGQKKTVKKNHKEYSRLRDHIGLLPVVMVAPVDQELITGGSEERRKLMDGIICQYDQDYIDDLIAYNRILQQRNALLKQVARGAASDASLWQVWDEQLAHFAGRVYKARTEFIDRFLPYFEKCYAFLTGESEKAGVKYLSSLAETDLQTLLIQNLQKDLSLQYTSAGVHKDDLQLSLNDHPIRRIGSQGQQKTLVLALKLAQFSLMKESGRTTPILLLDDIFDKLDLGRITRLMELVSKDSFGQIFLTDTQEEHIRNVFSAIGVPLKIFNCSPAATAP